MLSLISEAKMKQRCCIIFLLLLLEVTHSVPFHSSDTFISVAEFQQLLNASDVKIIDATYSGAIPVPDYKTYLSNYYSKFDLLMQKFEEQEYMKKHIPNAIPLSLDVACYPGQFKRYELYPASIFERLLRKLGINNGDRVIVYGRGSLGGMLYAARIWLLLKYYGVKKVQVLNGGLDAWERAGNSVTNTRTPLTNGNFKATTNPELIITFEELEARNDNGVSLIDNFETINAYDVRPADQYSGRTVMPYPTSDVLHGTHIKGAKSFPLKNVFNEKGELKKVSSLVDAINRAGYFPGKQTVLYCNSGNHATVMLMVLYNAGIKNLKVYQGGMTEMALRNPARIG